MAKNYNFKVTLGFETKGFQKGVKMVQASLNSLKMKFMSLGAAISAGAGINNFAKTLVETAKKMNQSQTTLKNVSNGYKEYAENQEYLIQLSNKYNQDILVLTGNFAKFHASSDQANVSLEDQKKIFESLTRAAAFYNLTADETNGVFLAITQMMSKGKVASEELRRQLGERLPASFELTAKALGMTTQELDKALREGKVLAKDALPKLADELNNVTGNIDVDTIQGWSNRLKNSVTNLTKNISVDKIYKNILKAGTKVVDWTGKNIKSISNLIVSTLVGTIGGSMWNRLADAREKYYQGFQNDLDTANKKLDIAKTKQEAFVMSYKRDNPNSLVNLTYNKEKGLVYQFPSEEFDEKDKNGWAKFYNESAKISKETRKNWLDIVAAQREVELAQQKLNKATKFWEKTAQNVADFFGGFLQSIARGAFLTAITAAVSKLIQMKREMKKIRDYVGDMNNEFDKLKDEKTTEQVKLGLLKEGISRTSNEKNEGDTFESIANDKRRIGLLKEINKILGLQGENALKFETSNEKINKLIEDRISLISKERSSEKANEQLTQARNELTELEKQKKKVLDDIAKAKEELKTTKNKYHIEYLHKRIQEGNIKLYGNDFNVGILEQIKDKEEIIKNRALQVTDYYDNAEKELSESELAFKEVQDTYNKNIKELNLKLRDRAITEDEYNSSLKSIISSTLDDVYTLSNTYEDIKVGGDEFSKMLLSKLKSLRKVDSTEMEKLMSEYEKSVNDLNEQYKSGLITFDELQTALEDLSIQYAKNAISCEKVNKAEEKYANTLIEEANAAKARIEAREKLKEEQRKREKLNDFKKDMPKLEERDSTFDYSKSDSDIKYEQADIWQKKADELQSKIEEISNDEDLKGMFDEVNKQLDEAIKNAKSFKDAADLSKVKEDINELKKSAFSSMSSGIDSISSILDRLVDDIDKLNNPELDGWQKLSIILNNIIQTFDGLVQSIEMFTELEKLINQITAAEQAQQTIEAAGTAASLAGSTAKIAAGQAEAMAGGTASAAKLPFPANIAAIGATIAALASIFAQMPKFASGGIVGGNSKTGDKILARLNSGEMVLNQKQQNALLNQMSGGNVHFEIKGDRLVGVLNNYQKKITK